LVVLSVLSIFIEFYESFIRKWQNLLHKLTSNLTERMCSFGVEQDL